MKLSRKELKKLIESFITGPLGTMDASDPYEKLHPDIKAKFDFKGSKQSPPVSGREYFLMYRNNPETLAQIASLDDSMKSDDQPYEASGPDDTVFDHRTGESMSKQFDIFDDPMGEYYSFDSIIKHYRAKMHDLSVHSKKHEYKTPTKNYIRHHSFYSEDDVELANLKATLYENGYRIINDSPPFSGKGGIYNVRTTYGGKISSSYVGKFAFSALEPEA
jgi:hypothetical protein